MEQSDGIVKFYRIVPSAIAPMRADASALGTLPTAAYQYCEAARSASAFGWYVFPPDDIALRWDGAETRYAAAGEWCPLSSAYLGDDFLAHWRSNTPPDLKDRPLPYLSSLFVPGVIQVWSGFLIHSSPGWSILVRAPANLAQSHSFAGYEGLIETDRYGPCPLFINIRLLATDREIILPKTKPLFQVQPLRRECYSDTALNHQLADLTEMSEADWQGFRGTIRSGDPRNRDHDTGSYGVGVRRRAKRGGT